MRAFARGIGRLLAAVLLIAIILVTALLVLLQTETFRDWLRGQVETQVNALIGGRLEIGTIEGDFFSRLIVHDVAIHVAGERAIHVERLAASFDLLRLIGGDITFDTLDLTKPDVLLRSDEQGWNLARLAPPGEPEPEPEPEEEGEGGLNLPSIGAERLTMTGGRFRLEQPGWNLHLEELDLRAHLALGPGVRAAIDHLAVTWAQRDLRVQKLAADLNIPNALDTIELEDVTLKTAQSDLRGRAHIALTTEAEYDVDLEVAHLSADELEQVIGTRVLHVDLEGRVRGQGPPDAIRLDETRLAGEAGNITLAGSVAPTASPLRYDVTAAMDGLDLRRLLGSRVPDAKLNGELSVTGHGTSLDDLDTKAELSLHRSSVAGRSLDEVELEGWIEKRKIQFETTLSSEAGRLDGNGNLDLADESYGIAVSSDGVDPALLAGRADLTGRLDGTIEISGTGFDPKTAIADATLNVTEGQLRSVTIERLDSQLHLANGTLRVETLKLQSAAARAIVSGELVLADVLEENAATAPTTLRYDIQSADLGVLGDLLGQPLGGAATIEGTAGGSIGALDLQAKLTGERVRYGDHRVGKLSADVGAERLGREDAEARMDLEAQYVDTVRKLRELRFEASGRLTGNADVALVARESDEMRHELVAHLERDGERITARVKQLRVDTAGLTWTLPGEARIVREGDRVEVDGLELRSDAGGLALQGRGGLAGEQNLEIRLDSIDVSRLVLPVDAEIGGTLGGRVALTGTAAEPRVEAALDLDEPRVGNVTYETIHADVRHDGSALRLEAAVVQESTQNRQLLLDATTPLSFSLSPFRFERGENIAGSLRAERVDLAFLDPMIPIVRDLRGHLNADLTIDGPPGLAALSGPLSIEGGSAMVRPAGLTYDPIDVRMQIQGEVLDLESLRIESRGGSIEGSGTTRYSVEEVAGQLTLTLDEFPIFQNRQGECVTSGRLVIEGSTRRPVVRGEVETDRFLLRLPEQLPGGDIRPPDPTIRVIGASGPDARRELPAGEKPPRPEIRSREKATKPPSLFERAEIDVDLRVPRNAWLRRSDANIELRGELRVWKKAMKDLRIAGDINTVRGWYRFQGRKFLVEEGQVTFTGQNYRNPRLDVVAAYEKNEYIIRILVDGTVQEPSIELDSEPKLEQADILSVLLFGKPADQLGEGESRGLQEQALGIASGYVASTLAKSVANELGLDTIEIDTAGGDLQSSSVSVGRYVSDDIFVSLAHKFGEQNVDQISVEYFLTRHWSLQTQTDTLGGSGVDLFWRSRFSGLGGLWSDMSSGWTSLWPFAEEERRWNEPEKKNSEDERATDEPPPSRGREGAAPSAPPP